MVRIAQPIKLLKTRSDLQIWNHTNRPYSYSRTLMWENIIKKRSKSFAIEKTPRIRLTCKLTPVQYGEYKYGLLLYNAYTSASITPSKPLVPSLSSWLPPMIGSLLWASCLLMFRAVGSSRLPPPFWEVMGWVGFTHPHTLCLLVNNKEAPNNPKTTPKNAFQRMQLRLPSVLIWSERTMGNEKFDTISETRETVP